ncbi:MAG: hypothetical protein AAGA78_14900, partial [Pseudomonadota bacterium]
HRIRGKPNTQNLTGSGRMRLAETHAEIARSDWREALHVAFDLGLSNLFNVEWLIEKAERGEWDGLWW